MRKVRQVWRWLAPALASVALAGGVLGLALQAPTEAQALAQARQDQDALAWGAALRWYADAARLAPDDPAPLVGLMTIWRWQRRYALAAQAGDRAERIAPGDPQVWRLAGTIAVEAGDQAGAAADWRRAVLVAPHSPEARDAAAQLAWLWLATDRPAAVLTLAAAPPSDDLAAALALAWWHLGQPAPALPVVLADAAPRLQPYRALAARWLGGPADLAALGDADLAAGLPALAVAPLRAAVAALPGYGAGQAYLAWALWESGQPAAALAALTLAEALAPDDPATVAGQALVDIGAQQPNAAMILLSGWLARRGDDPAILALLATAAQAAGDLGTEEAARWRLAQIAAPADRPGALRDLAAFYVRTGLGRDDGRAAWSVAAALAAAPDDGPTLDLAARFALATGHAAAALADLRRAVAVDPRLALAHADLGAWLWRAGDRVMAQIELQRAVDLDPTGPAATLAAPLLATGAAGSAP